MATIIQSIASSVVALKRCREEAKDHHERALHYIERENLPNGGGFDCGTTIDRERSDDSRVILRTSFHHMEVNGCYDGWTDHEVWVRPSFRGISIRVKGPNRNDIHDYIAEVFEHILTSEMEG